MGDAGPLPCDGHLVGDEPVVGGWGVEVDEPDQIPGDGAVVAEGFDGDAVDEPVMDGVVGVGEEDGVRVRDLPERLVERLGRGARVEPAERGAEAAGEDHVGPALTLARDSVGGEVGPVRDGVAEPREPLERRGLDLGFREVRRAHAVGGRVGKVASDSGGDEWLGVADAELTG